MSLRRRLERHFDFAGLNASWRTEILPGFTTFMTMAHTTSALSMAARL